MSYFNDLIFFNRTEAFRIPSQPARLIKSETCATGWALSVKRIPQHLASRIANSIEIFTKIKVSPKIIEKFKKPLPTKTFD